MKIKAIGTYYKNCHFRSRLEARWAIFFDTVGIKWEYEAEGFDLGSAGFYLPDFWLPDMRLWVEVKGNIFRVEESLKAKALASLGEPGFDKGILKIVGLPDEYDYINGYCNTYSGVDNVKYLFMFSSNPKFLVNPPVFFMEETAEIVLPIKLSEQECEKQAEESIWLYLKGIAAAKSARFEHGETPT